MNDRTIFLCDSSKCKLFLEKPVTLPCGHTICQKHIDNAIKSSSANITKFKCDLCSKVHQMPEDGGFQINSKISYLIESNRRQRRQPSVANTLSNNGNNRSVSVGKMPANSNNLTNQLIIQNKLADFQSSTKRKSISNSSSQSSTPKSPQSPLLLLSQSLSNSKSSRIPLPLSKRRTLLSDNTNDSGINSSVFQFQSTPFNSKNTVSTTLRAHSTSSFTHKENLSSPSRQQEQQVKVKQSVPKLILSSVPKLISSNRSPVAVNLGCLFSKPPLSPSANNKTKEQVRIDGEKVIIDLETYQSILDDLRDTKEILFKLGEVLNEMNLIDLNNNNDSLKNKNDMNSSLNDSFALQEFNSSSCSNDFVFEI